MVRSPTIVFVGGGEVGCAFLDVLVRARAEDDCNLVAVIASHKSAVGSSDLIAHAAKWGVQVLSSFDQLNELEQSLDLVISAGNHRMFSRAQIARPRLGIVNFHAAPLPAYRGSACPAFAILNAEKNFGVTFHDVVEELDAGPILHAETFPISDSMTAGDLDRQCIEVGARSFGRLLKSLLENRVERQRAAPNPPAPYRRKDLERHRCVDLTWPRERIWRHVRAFDWPNVLQPAFARLDDRTIVLTTRPRGKWL